MKQLLLIYLLTYAIALATAPSTPPKRFLKAKPSKGATISKVKVVSKQPLLPLAPKQITYYWSPPCITNGLAFYRVYITTNFLTYSMFQETTNLYIKLFADKPAGNFFVVTSVDTNGVETAFGTKQICIP